MSSSSSRRCLQTSISAIFALPVLAGCVGNGPDFSHHACASSCRTPDTRGNIAQDVTCDSDGKIEKYIGMYDYPSYLLKASTQKDEPYYLAVFLVERIKKSWVICTIFW